MNVGPYMKVYDECICVYNRRGYLSQHCKPSRTKGKNISVQKKRTSLVSHLFSSLRSSPNAYIDELRYLKIKRSHHYYQRERNGGVGKKPDILECLKTFCSDVSIKIVDAPAIVHIWSEPSKLQTFNNT